MEIDESVNTQCLDEYKACKCRYCEAELSEPFLDLGSMALANSYLPEGAVLGEEFTCPLAVTYCPECHLVQLSHVVPAEKMFDEYLYVSSTTKTFQIHFQGYAEALSQLAKRESSIVVDIGSNDGLLLKQCNALGLDAIGVEPAKNLSKVANENRLYTINRYFDAESVDQIISDRGHVDFVTANNVFAHVSDIHDLCEQVYRLLKDTGVFVIEFPYLVTMCEEGLFDMIYHEHLSYISVHALKHVMNRFGLEIFNIDKVESHGGSLRCFMQKQNGGHFPVSGVVDEYLLTEENGGYCSLERYHQFAWFTNETRDAFLSVLEKVKAEGASVCGLGAPAKGNTLLNFCKMRQGAMDYIVDDNPLKQDLLCPGSHIPIRSREYMRENPCDYIVILAWNFRNEIMAGLKEYREGGGKFIIPLPKLKVV